MIKLINEVPDIHHPYTAVRKIEIQIADESNLEEMLDAYKNFLQACGYTINGTLDVCDPIE